MWWTLSLWWVRIRTRVRARVFRRGRSKYDTNHEATNDNNFDNGFFRRNNGIRRGTMFLCLYRGSTSLRCQWSILQHLVWGRMRQNCKLTFSNYLSNLEFTMQKVTLQLFSGSCLLCKRTERLPMRRRTIFRRNNGNRPGTMYLSSYIGSSLWCRWSILRQLVWCRMCQNCKLIFEYLTRNL